MAAPNGPLKAAATAAGAAAASTAGAGVIGILAGFRWGVARAEEFIDDTQRREAERERRRLFADRRIAAVRDTYISRPSFGDIVSHHSMVSTRKASVAPAEH